MEYQPLPAVLDPLQALSPMTSPKVHPPHGNIYASKVIKKGNVEAAFAQAYRVFEGPLPHPDGRARAAGAARRDRATGTRMAA